MAIWRDEGVKEVRTLTAGVVALGLDDALKEIIERMPTGWLVFVVVALVALLTFVVISRELLDWHVAKNPGAKAPPRRRHRRGRSPDP